MTRRIMAVRMLLLLCAAGVAGATGTATAGELGIVEDHWLAARVEHYLSDQEGIYGVAAINLDDGRSVFVNADTSFPTASMYKVLVMYRVFQAIDRGDLSMEDAMTIRDSDMAEAMDDPFYAGEVVTVSEALDAMITVSSNVAAYALTRCLGGWGSVDSAAAELGMPDTWLSSGQFWSTPDDMAHFFRLLANRQLVSPDASERMIDLLLRQRVNDRLPALLPDGVQVAHKTGESEDVRNDGGIIRGPGGRYVLVVMSRGGTPDYEAQVEAELSAMIYRQYGA